VRRVAGCLPVVILAGGLGTRLGDLARARPKCLVDVNGEPFAVHQLRRLRAWGVRRVVFCLGHLGAQVVEAVGDGSRFGLSVDYVFDGPERLGTAGAVRNALGRLPGAFFLAYGDSYPTCPIAPVQTAFGASGSPALMSVFANRGRWDASNVEYAGGRIVAYDKAFRTPRMAHIDYGLGVFHPRAFDLVPRGRPFDLEALYQLLLGRGELASFEVAERFYEVGSVSGLDETRGYLAARRWG
jgi:MurNAc alpha-1-phosphate uridylyltransferase